MLTIRLKREGKKHQATMRIVVVDSKKSAISNRYVEKIGWWMPAQHKHQINKERALYWISKGAKMSATINNLFINEGIVEGAKIPKHKLNAFKPQPETTASVAVEKTDGPKETPKEIKEEAKEEVAQPEPEKEITEEKIEETAIEEPAIEADSKKTDEPKETPEEIKEEAKEEVAQPEPEKDVVEEKIEETVK